MLWGALLLFIGMFLEIRRDPTLNSAYNDQVGFERNRCDRNSTSHHSLFHDKSSISDFDLQKPGTEPTITDTRSTGSGCDNTNETEAHSIKCKSFSSPGMSDR
jgi:hypothetical protein